MCVNKDGDVEIADRTKGDPDWDCYEVLTQDLTAKAPGKSIADRVASTHEAINVWLRKNALDSQIFSPSHKEQVGIKNVDRLAIFLSAFDGLAPEDLARIDIPLDILVKLNSKK